MKKEFASRRRTIFILLTAAYSLAFLHRMSPAMVAGEMMRDFNVSAAIVGLLASAYFYPYAFMQAPCGLLTDRFGTRRLVSVALAVAGIGSLCFAAASGTTSAFIARVAVGLGLAMILVPANKALAQWYSARGLVVASSALLAIATGAGLFMAGTPLALASGLVGWRVCFAGLGGLTLAIGLAVFIWVKDTPRDAGFSAVAELTPHDLERIPARRALVMAIGNWNFWMFAVCFTMAAGVYFSFAGLWAGPYLRAGGLESGAVGSVLSVTGLLSAASPMLCAALAMRIPSRRAVSIMVTLLAALIALWAVLRNGHWGTAEMCVWTVTFAVALTASPGLYLTSVKELFPLSMSGTATGLLYAMPMLGSALYQPLVGLFLDKELSAAWTMNSFEPVFLLFFVSSAIALLAAVALKRTGKA